MLAGRVLSPDTSGEGFQAQSRNPMYGLAPYVAGGLAAVLMVDHLAMPSIGSAVTDWLGGPGIAVNAVDRAHKSDRLMPARAAARQGPAITAVEVVGLRNTAVVYRDREGRVLFRTDPVSNATLVAKDVVLPEITIRDSGRSTVNPLPKNSVSPGRRLTPITIRVLRLAFACLRIASSAATSISTSVRTSML